MGVLHFYCNYVLAWKVLLTGTHIYQALRGFGASSLSSEREGVICHTRQREGHCILGSGQVGMVVRMEVGLE